MRNKGTWIRTVRALPFLAAACVLLAGNTGCTNVPYTLVSDRQLNWYNSEPHTLEVRMFQFKHRKDFQAAGTWKTLCSEHFDMSLFLGDPIVERTLYPETTLRKKLRREKGARFVGVVACYYNPTGYPPRTQTVVPLSRRFTGLHAPFTVHLGPNQIERVSRRGFWGREKPVLEPDWDLQRDIPPWQRQYEQDLRKDVTDGVRQRREDATDRALDPLYR